jgi:hypothetical protein
VGREMLMMLNDWDGIWCLFGGVLAIEDEIRRLLNFS